MGVVQGKRNKPGGLGEGKGRVIRGRERRRRRDRWGRSLNQAGMMDLKDSKDLEAIEPDHSVSHLPGTRLT